jgi:predicted nucleic acid-binding Zn ribbon protein
MATYVYETVDELPPRQFEMRQSMNDRPLDRDPETGRPVRRIITGGFGLMGVGTAAPDTTPAAAGSCCRGGGCGCSH